MYRGTPQQRISRDLWILCLIARDALLPIYRIKRKGIQGLRIYVVIGGFSLLADALLRGSSVDRFLDSFCFLKSWAYFNPWTWNFLHFAAQQLILHAYASESTKKSWDWTFKVLLLPKHIPKKDQKQQKTALLETENQQHFIKGLVPRFLQLILRHMHMKLVAMQ